MTTERISVWNFAKSKPSNSAHINKLTFISSSIFRQDAYFDS